MVPDQSPLEQGIYKTDTHRTTSSIYLHDLQGIRKSIGHQAEVPNDRAPHLWFLYDMSWNFHGAQMGHGINGVKYAMITSTSTLQ
jgi:hypothetical protein